MKSAQGASSWLLIPYFFGGVGGGGFGSECLRCFWLFFFIAFKLCIFVFDKLYPCRLCLLVEKKKKKDMFSRIKER